MDVLVTSDGHTTTPSSGSTSTGSVEFLVFCNNGRFKTRRFFELEEWADRQTDGKATSLSAPKCCGIMNTITNTSICDGDARTVGGGRGWLAGDGGRGRHTLPSQPARSRHSAVEVRVFTLHTGAGWAW